MKVTKQDILDLYDEWLKSHAELPYDRFGQYVFYYTSYEYEHSFYETDPQAALNLLLEGLKH